MPAFPEPTGWDTSSPEPYAEYRARWPHSLDHIPEPVIETWIHRHWKDFRAWLPLRPERWSYEVAWLPSDDILKIGHVRDWPRTLEYWGNDLLDRPHRKATWLGRFMLEHGTTPAPIIVAKDAGRWSHPREHETRMVEPLQLVEGHLRLAYLLALIRRGHPKLRPEHQVVLATLPERAGGGNSGDA